MSKRKEDKKKIMLQYLSDVAKFEASKQIEIAKAKMDFAISMLNDPFKTLFCSKYFQNLIEAIQAAPPPINPLQKSKGFQKDI